MTDEQERAVFGDLVRWEGAVPWLYLDVRGFPTTGLGFLVKTVADSEELPWKNITAGREATQDEVKLDYDRVLNMRPALPAARYRSAGTRLELTSAEVVARAIRRLREEFLPALVRIFPDFDIFPFPAQAALIDLVWNLGAGRDGDPVLGRKATGLRAFSKLRLAVNNRDWIAASACSRRRTSRDARNEWTATHFIEASKEQPT